MTDNGRRQSIPCCLVPRRLRFVSPIEWTLRCPLYIALHLFSGFPFVSCVRVKSLNHFGFCSHRRNTLFLTCLEFLGSFRLLLLQHGETDVESAGENLEVCKKDRDEEVDKPYLVD